MLLATTSFTSMAQISVLILVPGMTVSWAITVRSRFPCRTISSMIALGLPTANEAAGQKVRASFDLRNRFFYWDRLHSDAPIATAATATAVPLDGTF